MRTLRPRSSAPSSASSVSTCAPKPPTAPSSIGDQHLVLARRGAGSSSRSSGLAKRASATVVESPRAASSSAAFSASASRAPSDRMAIREPSRRIAALADRQRLAALRQLDADALAARIAQRDRAVVVRGRGRDHVHELGLVGRRHHHHVRQAGEIGDVEGAGVGRRRRRRRGRRGRWRSGPAGSGSRRRARPGRSRAAGRSNRSRRTA